MPFDASFKLGPFAVDAQGRLRPSAPGTSPSMQVRWRGQWVRALLSAAPQSAGADGVLALAAVIGRVRSTASVPPNRRPHALETLRELPHVLPPRWRMQVQPDHSARIDAWYEVPLPATAVAVVSVITRFLLDLAPYLDLLADPEAGFEPVAGMPPGAAGMLNTCPG